MCGSFSGFSPPFPFHCVSVTSSCPLGGIGAPGWVISFCKVQWSWLPIVEAPGCLRCPTSTQRRSYLYSKNYSIIIFQQDKLPQFHKLHVLKNPSIYSHIIFRVNGVYSFYTSFRGATQKNTPCAFCIGQLTQTTNAFFLHEIMLSGWEGFPIYTN